MKPKYFLLLLPLAIILGISIYFLPRPANEVDYLLNVFKEESAMDKHAQAIQRFKWDYGSNRIYEALKEILYQRKDADIMVKRSAILSLRDLKDKRALDIFIDFLDYPDSTIKGNCLYSLWRLGADSRPVEPVMKLLEEPDKVSEHWTEKPKKQYFSSNDCPNKYSFDQPIQLLFDPFISPDGFCFNLSFWE